MRFLSLFSGIEAASVAWLPLGWECVAVAEIEKFPNAVLAHHYPDVPNLGDITKITREQIAALGHIDVVVGGFPCQDLSVAGKRAGLENTDGSTTRSGLFFTALRVAGWSGARWTVIENVPGLFSSKQGRDFAAVVGALAGCEFSIPPEGWKNLGAAAGPNGLVEWCVLDAQFAGVPQRRRRVFLVRDTGDWTHRPPVLFERHSLQGHPPPSQEKREGPTPSVIKGAAIGRKPSAGPQYGEHLGDGTCYTLNATEQHGVIAPTIPARTKGGGGLGTDFDCDGGLIAGCMEHQPHGGITTQAAFSEYIQPHVTHSLRGEGFDASEDGTGRGTPLVPVQLQDVASPIVAGIAKGSGNNDGKKGSPQNLILAFSSKDHGADAGETSLTLRAMGHARSHANAGGQVAVAFPMHGGMIGRQEKNGPGGTGFGKANDPSYTLTSGEMVTHGVVTAMQVRRLTPVECSRLQGFSDTYLSDVTYNGRCPPADGPMYKALGNSFAVPCIRWIGERIQMIDWLHDTD